MTVREALQSISKQIQQRKDWAIVLSVIVVLVFLSLWRIPKWQVSSYRTNVTDKYYWKLSSDNERAQLDRELLKAENEARTTLAQIIGGLGLLSGLYFTWRSLKINEDGKITDRYSKAIELLGSKNLDIRLGGIYALERIAKDSEKDHWTVMEALTAFIREHSPVIPKQQPTQGEVSEPEGKKPIATDIQAALTVIGRRKWIEQEKEKGQILYLSGAYLYGAYLYGANLSGADLSGAWLPGADLTEVHLNGANLIGADLIGAILWGANLSGAHLWGAMNLTLGQLSTAIIDDETKLPAEIEENHKDELKAMREETEGINRLFDV